MIKTNTSLQHEPAADGGAAVADGTPATTVPSSTTPQSAPSASWGRRLRSFADSYALVGVWVLMAAGFAIGMPHTFLQTGSFQAIFGSQAVMTVLALSVLCTLAIGEFDLSFAGVMGISATTICVLATSHHVPIGVACLGGMAAALVCGALISLFVIKFKVSSLVVTLGAATLLTGVAEVISHSLTVSVNAPNLSKLAVTTLGGMPIAFYVTVALTLVFAYVTNFTALGRNMRFVGSNREVARLTGIRVNRIRVGGYVVSSLFSGFAGVVLIATTGGYDPSTSTTYLLPALAAVFLGTAVVQPGRFNAIGSLIGIFFLETGIFGLQLLGYAGWIQDVFYGGGLVVAVTLATFVRSTRTE